VVGAGDQRCHPAVAPAEEQLAADVAELGLPHPDSVDESTKMKIL